MEARPIDDERRSKIEEGTTKAVIPQKLNHPIRTKNSPIFRAAEAAKIRLERRAKIALISRQKRQKLTI
jgi:hypothetical protein